jgi:hypothetical protein
MVPCSTTVYCRQPTTCLCGAGRVGAARIIRAARPPSFIWRP